MHVKLDLAHKSHSQVLIDSDNYTAAMLGTAPNPPNNNFTAVDIVAQITLTQGGTAALRSALTAPTSDTKTNLINSTRTALNSHLTILAGKVEGVANNPLITDKDIKLAIIHSACMHERNVNHPGRHQFKASDGSAPQTIDLGAQGGAAAHEWKFSADPINFTNQNHLDATTAASITTPVLAKQEFAFWHRPVTPLGPHAWEGPILWTVK